MRCLRRKVGRRQDASRDPVAGGEVAGADELVLVLAVEEGKGNPPSSNELARLVTGTS